MGQRRLDFLAVLLNLTDAQKEQAKAIFDAAGQATQALREQSKEAHDALRAAVKASKTDAEIDQMAAAVGTLTGQILAIHTKAEAKFYALLTAEQREKLEQLPGRGGPPRMMPGQ